MCMERIRSLYLPFLSQSVHVPPVVVRNGCEEGDRQRMEVELFQDIVDEVGPFDVLVYTVEGIVRSLCRQCWDVEGLAIRRDGGDTRCDTNADVAKLTELLDHIVDLPSVHSLRIENRLCIVKGYKQFL